MNTIGYEQNGTGALRLLVLNDWICDTSTWNNAKAYLDKNSFSWVFADLRGYGRSKHLDGEYNIEQSAVDVLQLADSLGWETFTIVGHSMSTLIALHLAQHFPERIDRVIVLTPPPPTGMGADEPILAHLKTIALGDDTHRIASLKAIWGDQLSESWVAHKVTRWRAAANPDAVAGYIEMFARNGLPYPTAEIAAPVLAVTGEQDALNMRYEAVSNFLEPFCNQLDIVPLAQCGHYPMQEMPPLLVSIIQRFLRGKPCR